MKTIKFLFGMKERVPRQSYILWGLSLMIAKYLGEMTIYFTAKNQFLTPWNFLSPLLTTRYPAFAEMPDWFGPAIVIWSLPFIWIGVGMSIRRAVDANRSPWTGVLFFVPGLNYLMMLWLAWQPTSTSNRWHEENRVSKTDRFISPLLITVAFAACGTIIVWFSTNFVKTYGTSLFVGSPLILGLVLGYFVNSKKPQNFRATAGYAALTILFIHLLLLLFALEGAICLAMSFPLSLALALIGSVFGSSIAKYSAPSAVAPCVLLLILPLLPLGETPLIKSHPDVVLSSIVIDAAPSQVWPNVINFPDLPKAEEWLFRLGVAHPIRARIDGAGIGAIRYCEFSTGSFVEPITTWNEPHHLAFDVQYQPTPMKELSFHDHVDAPHLDGYFRSVKGEFRLTPLPDGKTLLEGRTWYAMDMHPGWYWQMYGRWFIHKIHLRVLSHIKQLSEKPSEV